MNRRAKIPPSIFFPATVVMIRTLTSQRSGSSMVSTRTKHTGRSNEVDGVRQSAPLRSPDEVVAFLSLSMPSVYRLLRAGRLRGHKVGGQWRISDAAVRQFLEDEINMPK